VWLAGALERLTEAERELLRVAGRLMQELADLVTSSGAAATAQRRAG
jgi:hypothetical protein